MSDFHSLTKEWLEKFIEEGAALEHERWARWQVWIHTRARKNADGSRTISKQDVERWEKQIDTDYSKLSEEEQESDRREVRNYLPLLQQYGKALVEDMAKEIEIEKLNIEDRIQIIKKVPIERNSWNAAIDAQQEAIKRYIEEL